MSVIGIASLCPSGWVGQALDLISSGSDHPLDSLLPSRDLRVSTVSEYWVVSYPQWWLVLVTWYRSVTECFCWSPTYCWSVPTGFRIRHASHSVSHCIALCKIGTLSHSISFISLPLDGLTFICYLITSCLFMIYSNTVLVEEDHYFTS